MDKKIIAILFKLFLLNWPYDCKLWSFVKNTLYSFVLKSNCLFYFRKSLLETPEQDANYDPLPEERPGGFDWGQGERAGDRDQDQE